jgi:hypothetical protein
MNLPYTMTPDEAADAVKVFRPQVVIPYHYKGSNIQKFVDDLKGTGIEVRLLDWYSNAIPASSLRVTPPAEIPRPTTGAM